MRFSQEWIFKNGYLTLLDSYKKFYSCKVSYPIVLSQKASMFFKPYHQENWKLESLVRKIKLRINSRSDLYIFRLGDKRTKSFRISLTYWSWFWLDVRSGRCLSLIDYRYPNGWPWNRLFNRAFPSWPKV